MEVWNDIGRFFHGMPAVPSDFTAWDFLNSNLLLAIVGAVFTLVFKQQSEKQRETQEEILINATEKSKDEDADQDAEIEKAEDKPQLKKAAAIIKKLKDQLEKIADGDGRFKRTYDKIARYDYIALIDAMKTRDLKGKDEIVELLRLAFTVYRPFKSGRNEMTADALEQLKAAVSKLEEAGFFTSKTSRGAQSTKGKSPV